MFPGCTINRRFNWYVNCEGRRSHQINSPWRARLRSVCVGCCAGRGDGEGARREGGGLYLPLQPALLSSRLHSLFYSRSAAEQLFLFIRVYFFFVVPLRCSGPDWGASIAASQWRRGIVAVSCSRNYAFLLSHVIDARTNNYVQLVRKLQHHVSNFKFSAYNQEIVSNRASPRHLLKLCNLSVSLYQDISVNNYKEMYFSTLKYFSKICFKFWSDFF